MPRFEPTPEDLKKVEAARRGTALESDVGAAEETWARLAMFIGAEGADLVFSMPVPEALSRIEAVEKVAARERAARISDMYDAVGAVLAGKKGASELERKIKGLSR